MNDTAALLLDDAVDPEASALTARGLLQAARGRRFARSAHAG
ncbi:MAG: hypothetical protein ABIP57_03035 [Jatrophihabitantaceae bacterium]